MRKPETRRNKVGWVPVQARAEKIRAPHPIRLLDYSRVCAVASCVPWGAISRMSPPAIAPTRPKPQTTNSKQS